jgi:hypothetical protein
MSGDFDYGPLRTYEITWKDQPPEMVQGHQVSFESGGFLFGDREPRFFIHGEFPVGGEPPSRRWRLALMGLEKDVTGVRDVTDHLAELEAMAVEEPQS